MPRLARAVLFTLRIISSNTYASPRTNSELCVLLCKQLICNVSVSARMTPASVRCGDIVEVRFSIGLFMGSKSALFFKLILRAIISIDTSFARVCSYFHLLAHFSLA